MISIFFFQIIAHPVDSDMNEFFEKHVPANCIPVDFGGDQPSLQELAEEVFKENRRLKSFLETEERQIQLYKSKK